MFVENLECHSRLLGGGSRTIELRFGSDKYAELMRQHPSLCTLSNPVGDCLCLLAFALERANGRRRPVEYGNRVAPVFFVSIYVGHHRAEEAVRLRTDLVGGAVIDTQGSRTPTDVHSHGLPRKGLLKDALPEIAGKKESGGPIGTQGGKETQVGGADILRLVHNREVERHLFVFRDHRCQ